MASVSYLAISACLMVKEDQQLLGWVQVSSRFDKLSVQSDSSYTTGKQEGGQHHAPIKAAGSDLKLSLCFPAAQVQMRSIIVYLIDGMLSEKCIIGSLRTTNSRHHTQSVYGHRRALMHDQIVGD